MKPTKFDHISIEQRWREIWEEKEYYKTPEGVDPDNKMYILPQLPYPSGSGLHMGHSEVYTACDIYARFMRMQQKDVLQVIGWDAFGLPAENYAIKTNVHPKQSTDSAIDNFREQIKSLGISVDWDREVGSHQPSYYKWTQWFFKLMYNQGLAYRNKQVVNWCSQDKTVLANEQVEPDGTCERCGTQIELKEMEQWYLKITDYADRLAKDLDKVDWPEETIKRQRDWIGRSEGAQVKFDIGRKGKKTGGDQLEVFTTRPDTLFGVTFMVVAPEHPIIDKYKKQITNYDEVAVYVDEISAKTELERQQSKDKGGILLEGVNAINPVNGEQIPIFVAEYVLMDYGTGAIMAVPGHDERDAEFAEQQDLPVIEVVNEDGLLINSSRFNGLSIAEAKQEIVAWLESESKAKSVITYKLRDWSISRQRFWGAPIPIIKNKELRKKAVNDAPKLVMGVQAFANDVHKDAYYAYLQSELEDLDVVADTPQLPEPTMPNFKDWYQVAESRLMDMRKEAKSGESNNIVLHSRSLGSWVALKLAETHQLRKLILVCPSSPVQFENEQSKKEFGDNPELWNRLKQFILDEKIDFNKVEQNVKEILLVMSTNDPYISLTDTVEFFKERFSKDFRVRRFRNAGHFHQNDGYSEFPELLEEIMAPVDPGIKLVSDPDLPVELPEDVDFKPTGQSPLTYSDSFHEGTVEKYGQGWEREVDTMDTFMCSSWYFFRYIDPHNDEAFASPDRLKTWMPVDYYLGGPEHVNGHLLYSRFFTKVLYDAGYIDFDEPFLVHRHQGMILGPDGKKMSKRRGNVINPIDVVEEYGADTARLYLMFMGPLEQDKAWQQDSVNGVRKFVARVLSLQDAYTDMAGDSDEMSPNIHRLIKFATEGTEDQRYNVVIAEFMKTLNDFEESLPSQQEWQSYIRLLAPYAPFASEQIWEDMGMEGTVHFAEWPTFDQEKIATREVEVAIQVNGKVRDTMMISKQADETEAVDLAQQSENVQKHLEGQQVIKKIYVPGKIVNFVVKPE